MAKIFIAGSVAGEGPAHVLRAVRLLSGSEGRGSIDAIINLAPEMAADEMASLVRGFVGAAG